MASGWLIGVMVELADEPAALRHFFDGMVTRHAIVLNPALSRPTANATRRS